MKFVCVDLETTNLNANVGHILTACSLPLESDTVDIFRLDDRKYRGKKKYDDSKLTAALKEYLEDCFGWITWNGKMFDVPFLNSRLLLTGQKPVYRRMHIDLMYYARRPNLKVTSSRLAAIAVAFKLKEQKDEFDYEPWQAAEHLEKWGMDYVVEHCIKDVKVLKEAFPVLQQFIRNIHY